MTDPNRSAMVLGATGLVGSHCLELLLKSDYYSRVIALSRRPIGYSHPKLLSLLTNFEDLTSIAAQLKADDIFCALGTTIRHAGSKAQFRKVDFEYPLSIAEHVAKSGARCLVLVSAVGANSASSVFYLKIKGELENALAQLPFQSLHFLRPAMLDGKRADERLRERAGVIFSRAIAFLLIGPWKKYRTILASDVARAMLVVAASNQHGVHVYGSDQIQALVGSLSTYPRS